MLAVQVCSYSAILAHVSNIEKFSQITAQPNVSLVPCSLQNLFMAIETSSRILQPLYTSQLVMPKCS